MSVIRNVSTCARRTLRMGCGEQLGLSYALDRRDPLRTAQQDGNESSAQEKRRRGE